MLFIILVILFLYENPGKTYAIYITHNFDLEIDTKIAVNVFWALCGLFVFCIIVFSVCVIAKCCKKNIIKINSYGYKIRKDNGEVFINKNNINNLN